MESVCFSISEKFKLRRRITEPFWIVSAPLCKLDNSHGFFCTAITLSKNIQVHAHGRTEVFLIFSVSCNKSVYVCMNVQTQERERIKKRHLKAERRMYGQDSNSRMNATFAKLQVMWRQLLAYSLSPLVLHALRSQSGRCGKPPWMMWE